jgi:glycosyltransferase involved in cell wall biosynthesis
MHRGKTLTVVMPAYNEEANIAAAVKSFLDIRVVDEVLVVNNDSTDRTEEEAHNAGARVVRETKRGYGYASRRGLIEANSDFVAIVEPDGTFRASDIYKFLPYITEFDAVFGSRTSRSCIWEGANMGFALRIGNVLVAKLLEYLHDGPCLTDVGCTYKMFTRQAITAVKDYFTVGESHFSPELMLLCIRRKLRIVEIPLHYQPRVGESKITGDIKKAIKLGLVMVGLILKYRLKHIPVASRTILETDAPMQTNRRVLSSQRPSGSLHQPRSDSIYRSPDL